MTIYYKIITRIVVIYMMCSVQTVFGFDNDHVCNGTVSRFKNRTIPYNVSYKDCGRIFTFWCTTKFKLTSKLVYEEVPVMERTCCPGYQNRSGICEPECLPPCVHGHCAQSNNCTCDEHGDGNLCNNSSMCFIRLNVSEVESNSIELDPEIRECNSKCTVSDVPAEMLKETENKTYSLIPISSPCNNNEFALTWNKTIGITLGVLSGILLLALVISVGCIVRTKIRPKDDTQSRPLELMPKDHLVENTLYS